MDVNKMLASLRQERGHVDEVIIALERLAAGRQLRRGLVAAWLNGPPKTGRLPVMRELVLPSKFAGLSRTPSARRGRSHMGSAPPQDARAGSKMAGSWRVNTGDGHVTLRLPENFAADLDVHTGDGKVTIDFPVTMSGSFGDSDVRGKLNGGGQMLVVHTGDGPIRLQRL